MTGPRSTALREPLGDGQHHEGDDEQQEAQREQRRDVQRGIGLGEFVGQRGRDRIARGEQARREAVRIAEQVCRTVHGLSPVLAGVAFPMGTLSVSVGVSCRTFDESSAIRDPDIDVIGESLFRAADAALYVAKRAGRNRISIA